MTVHRKRWCHKFTRSVPPFWTWLFSQRRNIAQMGLRL